MGDGQLQIGSGNAEDVTTSKAMVIIEHSLINHFSQLGASDTSSSPSDKGPGEGTKNSPYDHTGRTGNGSNGRADLGTRPATDSSA
ncbi:hypothetical protein AZSP09_34560 [Azospira sp. I09]|jgi:hypothetical protein|nr:hypothetical protein AZSP09_34560 [Azospira sp. I09]